MILYILRYLVSRPTGACFEAWIPTGKSVELCLRIRQESGWRRLPEIVVAFRGDSPFYRCTQKVVIVAQNYNIPNNTQVPEETAVAVDRHRTLKYRAFYSATQKGDLISPNFQVLTIDTGF